MPFVQGQLLSSSLSVVIRSECGHCGRPLVIEMDWELNYTVKSPGAEPMILVPLVDFKRLEDPNIIDAF
jgi:hypothetical protein